MIKEDKGGGKEIMGQKGKGRREGRKNRIGTGAKKRETVRKERRKNGREEKGRA